MVYSLGKVRSTHRGGNTERILMMSICQTGGGDGVENKKTILWEGHSVTKRHGDLKHHGSLGKGLRVGDICICWGLA